ncbi:uncharacterized protein K452DRAFT_361593 [Aplosporella prunicola CBS 121167]|uniref:Uncharacterized protein n=1 Tax=Aplosporella prunicola CBS 121167 TaxID=1176127 RepID=A0A6A6B2U3_9PEZI|nr:uncharacterized protein K452DRAFT_361593 [Aplosporella prunicola CBS 121167]KAF2138136.1 hypothetical protein K452DRAFT_361593 [Aplosporella prunicola CBS 121167]
MESTSEPSSPYQVHIGTWTNWSRGPVFGATLTLNQQQGSLLIAFVAFFITMVGASFWRISCFVFHRIYSTRAARDGLHHQRQAILRNSANAASGFLALIQVGWAWRQYWRVSPVIAYTLICLGAFAIASGFSSQISSAMGDELLISSPNCGLLVHRFSNSLSSFEGILNPYWTKRLVSATDYAQQCYSSNSSNVGLQCGTFIKKRLPTLVKRNASCPFEGGICRSNTSNLLLDTGFLNSLEHFGVNTPSRERFLWRKVVHCAPLVTEGYTMQYNFSDADGGQSYMRYYYGKHFGKADFTYQYPITSPKGGIRLNYTSADPNYSLSGLKTLVKNHTVAERVSEFDPIPELRRMDGDLDIFFLSATNVAFNSYSNDSWYQIKDSSDASMVSDESTGEMDLYYQKEPASPMACVTRQQYCFPSLSKENRCTALSSNIDAGLDAGYMHQKRKDQDGFIWVSPVSASAMTISEVVNIMGQQALASRYNFRHGIQGPISENQWQLDVEHWHASTLAHLQDGYLHKASGPTDERLFEFLDRPANAIEKRLCKSQKMLSTEHASFSLFWLYFIFILGILVIIIQYSIAPILGCIQRRRSLDCYTRLEWNTNDTLQLQRLAHEELGLGTWSGAADGIPVTRSGEKLAVLDLTDPHHPKLRVPSEGLEGAMANSNESLGSKEAARVRETDVLLNNPPPIVTDHSLSPSHNSVIH